MCAQKLGIWKIFIFFSEIARAFAMWQMVGNRRLREPYHTHYRLQYGDKGGKIKKTILVELTLENTILNPLAELHLDN